MELKLRLHVAPISVNSMYYGNRLHGKTPEATSWSENVLYALRKFEVEIAEFTKLFSSKKHVITAHITMNAPVDFFFTKTGDMSGRLVDITNFEKPLIDLLMLPKFHGTNYPKTAINLNIDDRYLRKLTSEKQPSDAWYFDVIFRIEKKPTFVSSKDT